MHNIKIAPLFIALLLFFVVCFERVIGLPVLSFILFHHLFATKSSVLQGFAITIFSLIVASLYLIDPVVSVLLVLCGFIILQFQTTHTLQSKSWSYVYVSCAQAVIVAVMAEIVFSSSVLLSMFFQGLFVVIFLRKVVFTSISQVFHWQTQVDSKELHEKVL